MEAIARVDELRGYPDSIALTAQAPLKDVFHAELSGDFLYVQIFSFEGERGGPRDDVQSLDPGEGPQNLLGHAVTKIFLVLCRAQVEERQDSHAFFRGERRDWFRARNNFFDDGLKAGITAQRVEVRIHVD